MDTDNQGRKDDQEKLRYELIAPELDAALAAVLTYGAVKYEDRNWERGMDWSRPYAALKRHVDAWWAGTNFDPETGMPHLWHAACCLMFLVAYEARSTGVDDRPKDTVAPDPMRMYHYEVMLSGALGRLTDAGAGQDWGDIAREIADEAILSAADFAPGRQSATADTPMFMRARLKPEDWSDA
jgi:hypothetical protein